MLRLATVFLLMAVSAGVRAADQPASSYPPYHFQYGLDSAGNIVQLLVYRGDQQVQSLNVCTNSPVPRSGNLGGVTHEDFNFDGYPDVAMLVSTDRSSDNSYCIWLYDPATRRFVFSPDLSRLTNPQPDPATQTVTSRKNEGCSGLWFDAETFRWSGGRLQPLKEVSQSQDITVVPNANCSF